MKISNMCTKIKQLRFVLSVSSIFIWYHCYYLLGSFIRFRFRCLLIYRARLNKDNRILYPVRRIICYNYMMYTFSKVSEKHDKQFRQIIFG